MEFQPHATSDGNVTFILVPLLDINNIREQIIHQVAEFPDREGMDCHSESQRSLSG